MAWGLLKKRFDYPRAIKKRHNECPFAMPKVEKESAMAIRELIDYTSKHLRVLNSMGLPTDSWDELIIHMVESSLDDTTLRAWELKGGTADAKLETLTDFLVERCKTIERLEARNREKGATRRLESGKPKAKAQEKTTALANVTTAGKCYLCQGNHFLYHCENFLGLTADDRLKEVRRLKLCINCLRNDHFVKICKMGTCRECSGKHNTLCHLPKTDKDPQNDEVGNEQADQVTSEKPSSIVVVHHTAQGSTRKHVLMATAVVNATHPNGSIIPLRTLLDSASEAHFITHSACNRLGVKRERASETITGISEIENVVNQVCEIVIRSRHSNVRANIRSFIVPRITKMLPCVEMNRDTFKIPPNIKLADAEFYKRGSVDMLIGAEFFFDWLESGRIELGDNGPVLQNTKLGWIIAGSVANTAFR